MAAQATGGRLVVLSNRLPVTLRTAADGSRRVERSAGGLVAALEPALRRAGGTWVGWSGAAGHAGTELESTERGYRIAPVTLSQTEVRRYYHGFSNRTVWPLFHSFPTRMELGRDEWLSYEKVNQRFAHVASETADGASLFWIHDYQLMRVAPTLRSARPDARIAFFLHVPFPPCDLFRILPWDRDLLQGLLACDLLGFHCAGYAANFFDAAERLLGARVDREAGQVEHGERTVEVGVFPLGIDYELFEGRARAAEASPPEPRPERIVLGVDRLDYTKGLPEKIRAFERLFELHPEHRERVVLLQIAEPSRGEVAEYQRQKREVDELVGSVNGKLGTPRWTPIRYVRRSVRPEELALYYRDAEVALVTPLRDGMNLVAKEYVACQVGEPGVLILSRLAGAAETMHEAIRVNPYNVDLVAESLHQALTMDPGERTARMRALQHRERRRDVHAWLEGFLQVAARTPKHIRPVAPDDVGRWLGAFARGFRLALCLDYDGTLTPIVDHPSEAHLPDTVRALLEECVRRPDTEVAVVSGRALADLRRRVEVPGLVLAGNHGLEIEGPGLAPFVHPDLLHFEARARALAEALREIRETGVWLEEKGASLTLHFRQADSSARGRVAERARAIIQDAGYQVRDAHCAVEARPPIGWDKGHAVMHVLRALHGPAWSEGVRAVYVGDDETDEDAFRVLQGLGVTFRVGRAELPTLASHRLPNVEAVETLLRWVAKRPVQNAAG